MAARIRSFRLRLAPQDHARLAQLAEAEETSMHELVIRSVRANDPGAIHRVRSWYAREMARELRVQREGIEREIATLDERIHKLEPGTLFRGWFQETRDALAARKALLDEKISKFEAVTQ